MFSRQALKLSATAASGARAVPRLAARQQVRTTATSSPKTTDEAYNLLVAQRKLRPLAPHLTIYQPQLTWYMSSANRITGVLLAGVVYLYGIGYAVAPYVGMHLETATVAAAFAGLPLAAKIAFKATLATPFVFHAFNGCRHLIWDSARELSIKGVYRTGYVVLAATAVGAGYAALGM